MKQINYIMESLYDYGSRVIRERAMSLFNSRILKEKSFEVKGTVVCHPEPPRGMMWTSLATPQFLDNKLL